MSSKGKVTHLHRFHVENGRVESFAGFQMPMSYRGTVPEHLAVRNTVGLFDVTHMGRVLISGADAEAFLNYVTTNDVSKLDPMSAHYSTMCNSRGGIKDDFVLSQLETDKFFMVYNAANREKNFRWLNEHTHQRDFDVHIEDISENVAMFALQGPKAEATLQKLTETDLSGISRFKCAWIKLAELECFISRTGYTGEDGFEIFIWNTPVVSPKKAVKAWTSLLEAGKEFDINPCGLGARDTLRLEAGMCLYGNDIDEETTPLEARISFAVKLQKSDFIGRDALLRQKAEGVKKKRIGLKMLAPGIPRPKYEIYREGRKVGHITSGTYSPLLKAGVGMGYVEAEHAKREFKVLVKIREKLTEAEIVKFPLYDSERYGYARKQEAKGPA